MKLSKLLFLLVVSFLMSSCAILNKLNAPSLNGTPATSSLVVVKCEVTMLGAFDIRTSQQVLSGILLSTDGSRSFYGRAISNLIVFSDVPPGEYNLAVVHTTWLAGTKVYSHTYNVPPDKTLNFVINTKLGELTFLGVVTLEEVRKLNERGINFALKSSQEEEVETWDKFAKLYSSHPWGDVALKRVSELSP